MRVLMLCGFYPTHAAVSSGPKIVAREIDAMIGRGAEVVTVSFENELDRRHYKNGLRAPCDPHSRLFRLTRPLRVFAALRYPRLPLACSARVLVAGPYVKRLLEQVPFDDIRVEFTQSAALLPKQYWRHSTVVAHDILTQLYTRWADHATGLRRALARTELARIRAWEREVLSGFRNVVVLCEKDKNLVTELTGRTDVTVRYPFVPAYVSAEERQASTVDSSMMLFWGHMARVENIDAVHYFVKEIMPHVLAARPSARLVVAGIDPPYSVRALECPSITVTGFVSDPSSLFRMAAVGVVPLRLGAGIKIKTLELVNCGVPVVATTVGAEGVEPSALLTQVDGEQQFAASVIKRLDEACRATGTARYGTVRE